MADETTIDFELTEEMEAELSNGLGDDEPEEGANE